MISSDLCSIAVVLSHFVSFLGRLYDVNRFTCCGLRDGMSVFCLHNNNCLVIVNGNDIEVHILSIACKMSSMKVRGLMPTASIFLISNFDVPAED